MQISDFAELRRGHEASGLRHADCSREVLSCSGPNWMFTQRVRGGRRGGFLFAAMWRGMAS